MDQAYASNPPTGLRGNEVDEHEEHALYQALVSALSDMGEGLVIIEHLQFTFVNDALCNMVGYSGEELTGWSNFVLVFHPDEQARIMNNHRRRLAGEQFETYYETALRHKDGHRVDVDISVAHLHTNHRSGVIVTIRDITQRKAAEAEIKRKNIDLELLKVSLEQKVYKRTSELQRANRELTRLNQVKSDFISIVSHELRTPLTSIKSFAEILLDDGDDTPREVQQRYLSIINSESDRLSRLISDVLDLQKIDAGKIVWNDEIINVVEIARTSVDLFMTPYTDKGLSLTLETESDTMTTDAESDRISQVLNNLLSNALKFTESGGVQVSLKLIESPYTSHNVIQVAVKDTGIGIPTEEISRVFERFYQVDDSQRRKQGGTGLGLSISKDIVEHYQGSIQVESELGKGSTFYVTLPELKQPRRKLGEVLIELGMLTEEELSAALSKQEQS